MVTRATLSEQYKRVQSFSCGYRVYAKTKNIVAAKDNVVAPQMVSDICIYLYQSYTIL